MQEAPNKSRPAGGTMRLKKRAGFAAVTALVFAGGTVPAAFADEGDDLAPPPTRWPRMPRGRRLGWWVTAAALHSAADRGEVRIDLDYFGGPPNCPPAAI